MEASSIENRKKIKKFKREEYTQNSINLVTWYCKTYLLITFQITFLYTLKHFNTQPATTISRYEPLKNTKDWKYLEMYSDPNPPFPTFDDKNKTR